MDLVVGVKKIILALTHQSKDGEPKLVRKLTYPSSGVRKADLVVTEKAVFEFKNNVMYLIEMDPSLTIEELKGITEADFQVSPNLTVNYK